MYADDRPGGGPEVGAARAPAVPLARLRLAPRSWHVVRRSWVGFRVWEPQQSSRFIRFATAGAVVYAAALPLLSLCRMIETPIDPGRTGYAVAALACYLPLEIWLVLSAAREATGSGQRWALATLAVLTLAMVPVIGVGWLGAVYPLAALVLVSIPAPWSIALFAGLVALPAPVAFAFGHPQWASYYTLGVPFAALPLAVVIRLTAAAVQLQAARLALAQQAVIGERLRIDAELRQTVGATLEAVASQGDRAGEQVFSDPSASRRQLRALVGAARQALADARRMLTRYQEVSLRTEVETAATLLTAAGVPTRVLLPSGELPDTLGEADRALLRRGVARLLRDDAARTSATITLSHHDGRVQLELGSDETDPASPEVRVQ